MIKAKEILLLLFKKQYKIIEFTPLYHYYDLFFLEKDKIKIKIRFFRFSEQNRYFTFQIDEKILMPNEILIKINKKEL